MTEFKVLFAFSSPDLDVLEIKKLGYPEGTPPSTVYQWLILYRNKLVFDLDFRSMNNNGSDEFRAFEEGELKFNAEIATFTLFGQTYELKNEKAIALSTAKIQLVQDHLESHHRAIGHVGLRSLKPSDVAQFKSWIFDGEVIRYSMTKFHRIKTETQALDWYQSTLFDTKTFQVALIDPSSKKFIGYAGIASLNEIDGNGEYFIFIGDKSFWGKGIATTVTKEIVRIGFQQLKLHRIFLTASSKNPSALRAYEKAGFINEGRMREAFFRNGEYSDKVIMGILQTEFSEIDNR